MKEMLKNVYLRKNIYNIYFKKMKINKINISFEYFLLKKPERNKEKKIKEK